MNRLGWMIGAVLVAGVAAFAWQATRPTAPAAGAMVHPDLASLDRLAPGAAIVQVTLPAQLSPEALIGKRGFDAICAACHGANGAGQNGVGPPLIHRTYEPSHHGDMSFYLATKNGVRSHHWPFGNMPPVQGLTRADVQLIVEYVRELQRANEIY